MLKKFILKDCNRLDSEHYIFTLIYRANLLQDLKTKNNNLFIKLQNFDSQYLVLYIYEKYYLKAAYQFLTNNKEWWVTDLYSDNRTFNYKCLTHY